MQQDQSVSPANKEASIRAQTISSIDSQLKAFYETKRMLRIGYFKGADAANINSLVRFYDQMISVTKEALNQVLSGKPMVTPEEVIDGLVEAPVENQTA